MQYISAKSASNPLSTFRDIRLPYSARDGERRVAFVISRTFAESYAYKKLLAYGTTEYGIYDAVLKNAGFSLEKLNMFAIPCDAFAPADSTSALSGADSPELLLEVDNDNREYVLSKLYKYKPDVVVAFGVTACKFLNGTRTDEVLVTQHPQFMVGIPQPAKIKDHEFTLTGCPCPVEFATGGKKPERTINLLGQVSRIVRAAINGELEYKIRNNFSDARIIVVDTIAKFDKLLKLLYKKPIWGFDTEARSLARISNSLQILQCADSQDRAFVLPIKHKSANWTPDELAYILEKLGDYFYDNENILHLYHNASFDLPLLRAELGIAHYCADVWDRMAGEFAFDENLSVMNDFYKAVNKACGGHPDDDPDSEEKKSIGHHTLLAQCLMYGNTEYLTGSFGKESRVNIHALDLYETPDLIRYCALDVLVLMGIFEQQIMRAHDANIRRYSSVAGGVISDQLNTFGTMQRNGTLMDVEYLWRVNAPNSKIYALIDQLERDLRATPEVKRAEEMLLDREGKSRTNKLFSTQMVSYFDFGKSDHLKTLFYDVMELESPTKTESGSESYSKGFKEFFSKVNKIVAQFDELGKAQKLKAGFLAPLLEIANRNPDTVLDGRVRAWYQFISVLTGRIAATKPNTQQIPSRGALAKVVKRIFIAPKGSLFLKVDFSAHELRLWAVTSKCPDLSAAFQKGLDIISAFRKKPDPSLVKRFTIEGDVHRVNTVTFGMAKSPELVTDDIRGAVKGIAFGAVYGRSMKSLAAALKMPLEDVENIFKLFFSKLKNAAQWLLDIEKYAQSKQFVASGLNRRRNLFGLMLYRTLKENKSLRGVFNALSRRSRNSPIQGLGSDLGFSGARLIEKLVWWETKDNKRYRKNLPLLNCNMVHDSSEMEAKYAFILPAIEIIEYGLTLGNQRKAKELHGMDFSVDLAIEMEIGPNLAMTQKWAPGFRDKTEDGSIDGKPVLKVVDGKPVQKKDKKGELVYKDGKPVYEAEQDLCGDFNHLHAIIEWCLKTQISEHNYDIDVDAVMRKIFVPSKTPKFLLEQAKSGMFRYAERYGYDTYDMSGHQSLEERIACGEIPFEKLIRKEQQHAIRYLGGKPDSLPGFSSYFPNLAAEPA